MGCVLLCSFRNFTDGLFSSTFDSFIHELIPHVFWTPALSGLMFCKSAAKRQMDTLGVAGPARVQQKCYREGWWHFAVSLVDRSRGRARISCSGS